MIDVADELLTLAEASAALPRVAGKRPHVSTLWRWCCNGVKARSGRWIQLEHLRLGNRCVTTLAALQRFAEALASDGAAEVAGAAHPQRALMPKGRRRTPAQRDRAVAAAEARVRAAGV